jgi:hypothetical protein
MGHIAHLSPISQFFPIHVKTYKSNFPHCCPGGYDIIWNLLLHLNRKFLCKFEHFWFIQSWRDFFYIILLLKKHLKLVFPQVAPTALPQTHNFKILIMHYIRRLLCQFELFWLSSYSKQDFKKLFPLGLETYIKKFPYCDTSRLPGTMILTRTVA